MPIEETFRSPMKHIDVTRTTYTSLDVLLEKRIEDYWNVDGEKRLVRCMDRIHKICSSKGKATGSLHMVQGETCKETNNVSSLWKFLSDAAKKKAKQRWAIEKPKLVNARQLRGIFFIEPNDEEFKITTKGGRGKLEVPMPAARPCKIPLTSSGEIHRHIWKRKTKYACIVDADESMRIRLVGVPQRYHEDHIAAVAFWLKPFLVRTCTEFFPFTSFLVLLCSSVNNPILLFATSSHGTCERRNKCADISSASLFFEFWVSKQFSSRP